MILISLGTEEDGKNFLSNMIKGSSLTATIVGFAEDDVPLIKLLLTNDEYEVNSIRNLDFYFCSNLY